MVCKQHLDFYFSLIHGSGTSLVFKNILVLEVCVVLYFAVVTLSSNLQVVHLSWMYGILSNTQGNLWICMLLHPVCFEIVFANHKPFLPFTKLRLVVSMEKKHTSSWFGTPIAHDSAQLGRVLLKMFLISTSFHLIFLQPDRFTWKTS